MKVSVLSSIYYKEQPDHLDCCFESLYNQSHKADEVVLVHDGPLPAKLISVIDKWKELLPIKEVKLKNNVGLGKALNIGLENCLNECIARVDTDDICRSDRLEKQVNYLNLNPDVSLISSDILEFEISPEDGKKTRKVPKTQEEIEKVIKFRNPFNHMAIMYRKSSVINSGSYQHFPYMEDYDLWIRMMSAGVKAANIDESLVYARIGNGMIGRRRGLDYVKSEFRLAKEKYDLSICNSYETVKYLSIRVIARLMPTKALSVAYNNFARN